MARVKRSLEQPAPREERPLQWLEELIADPRGMPPKLYDNYPTSTKYRGPR